MFWNCNVYMLIESIYTDDFHRDKKKSEQTNIGDWQRQWSILAQIRWHSQREFVLGQSKHRTTLWCMLKFRVGISVLRGRWTLTEKIDVWTPSMVHIQISAATYHSASQSTPSSWGNSVLGKINFYCIEKRNHHNIVAKSFWGGKKRATRHAKPNGIYAPCVCVLSLDGRRVAPTLRYSTDRLFTMTTTTNSRHAFSQWFDGQLRAAHSSESR